MQFISNPLKDETFDAVMEPYLPKPFRQYLETQFYAKVGAQSTLSALKNDASFRKDPINHIGLYSDHSVVHVRDVAVQSIALLERINGILIPLREEKDFEFLKAYALQLVYLHDIGMSVFSDFGRFMHPEFAAQFVFSAKFDDLLEVLWENDAGKIPSALQQIFAAESTEKVKLIYRELLTLSMAHSKSKVPIDIINDPVALRNQLLKILSQPLKFSYYEQKIKKLDKKISQLESNSEEVKSFRKQKEDLRKQKVEFLKTETLHYPPFQNRYENYETEAFTWLLGKESALQKLIINVQDTLRCIRAADALRQRGTVLRTSAGYEIFIDKRTANAVYALRDETNDELYLLQSEKAINAGEANLASSDLDGYGNLRVSFHLGAFYKNLIVKKAAKNVAVAIDDIQADIIQSFRRNDTMNKGFFSNPIVSSSEIKILIENTNENPEFTPLVCQSLAVLNPTIKDRIKGTYSFKGFVIEEVNRYLAGTALSNLLTNESFKTILLKNIKKHKICALENDTLPGQSDIRVIQLKAGEQLVEGGSPSGFVYYPMSNGLMVHPMGGYEARPATAWIPLGNSSVIRGAVRNASILAEKELQLLCIPRDVYLKDWYQPFTAKDLLEVWGMFLSLDTSV